MQIVRKIFGDKKQTAFALSAVGLFGLYYFYARQHILGKYKKKRINNDLKLRIKRLVQQSKNKNNNTVKIVITQSSQNERQFSSQVVTKLKQVLQSMQLTTLVNGSPLKLFHSGCQVFLRTLCAGDDQDQQQFMSYFQNALRFQLLIQRTIVDINNIRAKQKPAFLICDSNSIDIKVHTDFSLWKKFLSKLNINQSDIINNYQIVFHIINTQQQKQQFNKNNHLNYKAQDSDDFKISRAWKDFQNYYIIKYDNKLSMQNNVQIAVSKMIQNLNSFLPKQFKNQINVKEQSLNESSPDSINN